MSPTQGKALPTLDTSTLDFHLNPNRAVAAAGGHDALAALATGTAVMSYDTIRALLMDRRFGLPDSTFWVSLGATPPVVEFLNDGLLLYMEPSRHERVRRTMVKGFKPSTIEAARPMMRGLAGELIDGFAARGNCEFVGEFSHHYSIGVISRFIGVPPEDVPLFDHATVELMLIGRQPLAPWMPRLEKALATLKAYVPTLIAKREREPRADLVSDLIAAQRSEGRLSENELIWGIANLLLAGHDTTRFQMASCLRAILEAGLWEQLARDPERVPAAIAEGMRLYPVTPSLGRITREDVAVCGHALPRGASVGLMMGAAGRDPRAFPDPDRFRLDRGEQAWDIGFGRGAHYCLGHALAEAEMDEAIRLLARRLADVSIDGEVHFAPAGSRMWGPETLPLRFRSR